MAATKIQKKETVEKKEERKGPGKKGALELISETFNDGIKYLEKNVRDLFVDMLKIEVLSLGVFLVLAAIAVAPWFIFLAGPSFEGLNIPLLVFSAIVFTVALLLSVAISSAQYNAVDKRAKNGAVAIIPQSRQNFMPVIAYYIIITILMAVAFLPAALLFISGNVVMMLGAFALLLLAFLVLIVAGFLLQFGLWELVINRRGPFESMKRSCALVTRGNIIKILLFDICFFVASFGFGLIFSVLNFIVQIIASLFELLNAELGLAASLIASLLVSAVEGAVIGAVLLPFAYLFWKKLEELGG